MNFLQLVQRLHRESGRSTTAPTSLATATVSQLRLFDAVNDAWLDIQCERGKDWQWMRQPLTATLAAGVARYTGADLGAINFSHWRPEADDYWVRCSPVGSTNTWWDVQQMSLDRFKANRYDVIVARTTPMAWTVDNDETLWLWGQPAQAYGIKIDAISAPVDLLAETDIPGMPKEFHLLLMWQALLSVAITDAAPEMVQKAQMHCETLRQRLVMDQGRVPCL